MNCSKFISVNFCAAYFVEWDFTKQAADHYACGQIYAEIGSKIEVLKLL